MNRKQGKAGLAHIHVETLLGLVGKPELRVRGMELYFENFSYGLRLASSASPMAIWIKEDG